MKELYAKLYTKYSKLKKEKESEVDKLNSDQEEKFVKYASASDEMIKYLSSMNDQLRGQVDELQSELASIRSSSEQEIQYQKLWEEENQKNKELTEKISRLQKIEHGECSLCIMHEETGNDQENSHENTPCEGTPGKTLGKLTKKRKSMHIKEGAVTPYVDLRFDRAADKHVYGNEDTGVPSSIQQPLCCQRKIYSSGGDSNNTSSVNCVFQYLIEFLVGMKISPLAPSKSNELCILAHHQSSGYSFTLTWITNSRGETELLYRVLSLGTFERVAPEWMKETLMFSTSMCSIFFDRVSRVIKS